MKFISQIDLGKRNARFIHKDPFYAGKIILSGETGSGIFGADGTSVIDSEYVIDAPVTVGKRVGAVATTIDAQNGTPTIAQLLGGFILHNSKTGGGTLTTPTGAVISAGVTGVAVGDTFECTYVNYGDQTVTITAGASGVTITGTAAVPADQNAKLVFLCTDADTWVVYVILSA
jgi:uncharacterized Zn-binding protein involved in type VI secretion